MYQTPYENQSPLQMAVDLVGICQGTFYFPEGRIEKPGTSIFSEKVSKRCAGLGIALLNTQGKLKTSKIN